MAANVVQRNAPPEGYLHLVLYRNESLQEFYLEIPVANISRNSLRPRKYLKYLGWCILDRHGEIRDDAQQLVDLDGEIASQEVYKYDTGVAPRELLQRAVDPHVIKQRTATSTRSSETRIQFAAMLQKRDAFCIFSGYPNPKGCHLIPFARGSEWLQIILRSRSHEDGEDTDLSDINDIRNGFLASSWYHDDAFERRYAAILKTPNPILKVEDIPPRTVRKVWPGTCYPPDTRYTFQWLVTRDERYHEMMPNGIDAAFLQDGEGQKPSATLLHYNYGAAAVKQWGKSVALLEDRADVIRPTLKVPDLKRPYAEKSEERYKKLRSKRDQDPAPTHPAGQSGTQKVVDSEGLKDSERWDEDDVLMFFRINTPHAQRQLAEEERNRQEYITHWRAGISSGHNANPVS